MEIGRINLLDKDFLSKYYYLGSNELNKAIKDNLLNHIGKDKQLMDDVTYLIMEVHS